MSVLYMLTLNVSGWFYFKNGRLILLLHTKLQNGIYQNYFEMQDLNFSQQFLPELLLFHNNFLITGEVTTYHKAYESPAIIFQYKNFSIRLDIFFYFWFIRLLNSSNYFLITFSFNDFIHADSVNSFISCELN